MADPNVKWFQLKSYSGPWVSGTVPIPPPTGDRAAYHVDRSYWLTAKVESGAKFGAVVMYDGTAATCGPDQHIAVYPKELSDEDYNAADDQGGLWKLLRRLETVQGGAEFEAVTEALFAKLRARGWYLSQDGVVRYAQDGEADVRGRKIVVKAGDLVHGANLRDELTPAGGKVPTAGDQWEKSKAWALAFHRLFVHPDGHKAQIEFGKEHLVERSRRRQLAPYTSREITALRVGDGWSEDLDLAMCIYQSNSVNAPAIAVRALASVGQAVPARALIRALGNNAYGRWDDDIPGGRYQRTRDAARASGLWSPSLFEGPSAVMPKDLPG